MSGKENWADIPGHPGYQASDLGRIRSVDRIGESRRRGGVVSVKLRGKIIQAKTLPNGYVRVHLGSKYADYVHRLVLLAFVGDCPPGLECAHDDGIRGNNQLGNLAWKTRSANGLDRRRHGTATLGERNPSWAGSICRNGHAYTEENTRLHRRGDNVVRICRACVRERMRKERNSSPDRYRDGWDEKLRAGLDLMKSGMRAMHAARSVGIGRAALGKAWKAQGGPRLARPKKTESDAWTKMQKRLLVPANSLEDR